jgi:DnaJ-domain-containing protein 1
MQQPSLYEILKAFQQGGVEGAVRALGLARRTVVRSLATASADELKTVYQQLLWEYQRERQGLADRVRQLDAERAALASEHNRLQCEIAGLRAELQALRKRPPRRRRGASSKQKTVDDAFALLYVSPQAPPEVIEAAFRALAKQYHPDRGGSTAQMQRLNLAREQLLSRNGQPWASA